MCKTFICTFAPAAHLHDLLINDPCLWKLLEKVTLKMYYWALDKMMKLFWSPAFIPVSTTQHQTGFELLKTTFFFCSPDKIYTKQRWHCSFIYNVITAAIMQTWPTFTTTLLCKLHIYTFLHIGNHSFTFLSPKIPVFYRTCCLFDL